MREPDFSVEDQEQETGYWGKQAVSEFSRIVAREKYNTRRGRVLFLRDIGRKERLLLSLKYGKRWQENSGA